MSWHRALRLDGWDQRSVWGLDTGEDSYYAQLYRDDAPPADRDTPEYSINRFDLRRPIDSPAEMARVLHKTLRVPLDQVTAALLACQAPLADWEVTVLQKLTDREAAD